MPLQSNYVPTTHLNSNTITYRNAIYQGTINQQTQLRQDFGILYIAKTHEFICCNNWHNDTLQGQCLFYNQDKKYVYGTWINNLPQGFNVFRFDQTLVMAEFHRGRIGHNSKVLIIFQRYNLGLVLIVCNQPQGLDDLEFQVFTKEEVYSSEDVKSLFNKCQWPEEYFMHNQTLIKYISSKLTQVVSPYQNKYHHLHYNKVKLRLIQNKYYRFGYDQGIVIIFDEDFNRISVGCHSRSKLTSFGTVFENNIKSPMHKHKNQGRIIKMQSQNSLLKTAIKSQLQKTSKQFNKPTHNINTSLLMGMNFCNKFYKNPSKLFTFYIENILKHNSIRDMISGSLTSRRLVQQQESLGFSRIQSNRQENNNFSSQFLNRRDQDTNKKSFLNSQLHDGDKKLDKNKILQDRLRLQSIKKEIYGSLEKRKQNYQKAFHMNESRQIINKDIVGKSYYNTPERTVQRSRSRRRRIFQQSQKNLKILRDFTPTRSQPNLTPFKTKMKNRIFNGQSSKISQRRESSNNNPSQTKNRKNKYSSYENEEIQIRPATIQDFSKFSSDKRSQDKQSHSMSKKQLSIINNNSLKKQQHQRSENANNYRVRFEENKKYVTDSDSQSKKYPSQGQKNVEYVPINSTKQKQRKRTNQVLTRDHINSEMNDLFIGKRQVDSIGSNSKNRQPDRRQLTSISQKQKIIPRSNNYIEQKQSGGTLHNRMLKQLQTSSTHKSNLHAYTEPYQHQHIIQRRQLRKQLQKQKQRQYQRQVQYQIKQKQTQKSKSKIKQSTHKNSFYNDDTFKQPIPQQQYSITKNQDHSKRSAFKHSNQIYLDQYSQHKLSSPTRQQPQSNKKSTSNNNSFYSTKKSNSYLMKDHDKKSRQNNSSYMHKHKIKKSIEKEIEKSPDRHRCYGKSGNTPYLEASPGIYSKQYSNQNSYTKADFHYDSSNKVYRNQNANPAQPYRPKLF